MLKIDNLNIWLMLLIIGQSSAISYNQPKFSPCASWNPNATTFANSSLVGLQPWGAFVSTNNTIYIAALSLSQVLVWPEGSNTPIQNISDGLNNPYSVFVTSNGDIYIDNGDSNHRVDKWASNATSSVMVMSVTSRCMSLFIDINDTLYCSNDVDHKVVKMSLKNGSNTTTIAAGNGTQGSGSYTLNYPNGIFVDIKLNLYVADSWNNRIQFYQSGYLNGSTIVTGTITFNGPVGVTLDADGYLFISDHSNNRVVGSGPLGFRCLVGCSAGNGSGSNQLHGPYANSFDSFGNIFVVDMRNSRIQKFLLATNSCYETTAIPTTTHRQTERLTTTHQQTSSITSTTLITSSKVLISNKNCFAPIIILIPGGSSLVSPMQFRRNQDFYISSSIQLKCNTSLATTIKWTIKNCTSSTCSFPIAVDPSVITTLSELYIPARILSYGIYQLILNVTMMASPDLTSSTSAYVAITPAGITVNFIQYGTSMITRGYQQNLTLDPGSFSVDLDGNAFNASDWKYQYYCRIYGLYNFPNTLGLLLTIDDPTIDPLNPSCLTNPSGIQFSSSKSSLTILAKSLLSNRTYQFMVRMESSRNSSTQATGYLLVRVDNSFSPMIAVACVISAMCVSNLEFQLVNPTTQVALFSLCLGSCPTIQNITWNIYQGSDNGSSIAVQWTRFTQMMIYQNIWFFGADTSNFTASNQLFLNNPQIEYWRFEVVYSFLVDTSSSSLNFVINKPPQNGSCSISPFNGTISTLFTISCINWFDQDGIKDYSFYTWTTDRTKLLMLGFTPISTFDVRLPAGNDNTSLVNLVVHIRDTLDCVSEYNLSSPRVVPDTVGINNLIANLQVSTSATNNNPIVQLLAGGNPNVVGQVITSLSQVFNKMNSESLDKAVSSGVPAASISVSSLSSQSSSSNPVSLNQSALTEFHKQLNTQANVRDYLMSFTTNLAITTSNSIQLQASSLAQLTQATNQLTRTTTLIASNKCYRLAVALYSMASRIPYEDVLTASIQITECTNNVMSAINGPLQQRTTILDLDLSRANTVPQDYDTDLESEWANPSLFADGNDFSPETIEKNRNIYYQKQIAKQIADEVTKTSSFITAALNIHLNIGQNMTMNTPSVFMSLETISFQSLSNKMIEQVGNARIHLPSNVQTNSTDNGSISLRSLMQPLAAADQSRSQSSNTNLSRSISLTVLDQYGNEVSIQTNLTHPIELIIPRDPNIIIPSMILQNITSIVHQQLFNLHYINITSTLSISIHLEIHPLNANIGYLLIYKFDSSPQLNSSIQQIDGWTVLCPSNQTNDTIYTYFVNNQRTSGHRSMIFGLRELNSSERTHSCSNLSIPNPPITNERFNFTSNYELRVYTFGCYYLDQTNQWQSDGLTVGPLTNHYQTQCFSIHLTTFASGFIVLSAPVNWSYVFAHADFMKNKTVYLTVMCVSMIYLLLVLYARYKDLEKLGVISLLDNHQSDQYFYQILVFTGQRKESGTTSKVHFILSGEKDDTQVRTLADPHRKILQRGGIDAFILAVPKSLGLLNYLRIWHDNTGHGTSASWFLKYLIVQDLQTMDKFHFICQQWLAVEKDDGKIERVLFVASELEKQAFSYIFSRKTYHNISEGHLWFSIFSRPIANQFTRVQRCTCCFVLFFISMFLNIMYYDLSTEAKLNKSTSTTTSLSLGPLYISSQQIAIDAIVELLSLSFLLVGVSILFIIARGIEFGDLKTQKWLRSILTGFFSSILFTQPLKVLCLTIFFAFVTRDKDDDREAGEHLAMDNFDFSTEEEEQQNKSLFTSRPTIRFDRLNEAEVAGARHQRLKELHMWSIIREAMVYIGFLVVLAYSNRDQNAFYQMNHLKQFFLNSRQIDHDYTMRQIRLQTSLCSHQKMIINCRDDVEEKRSFDPGWMNETTATLNSSIDQAFQYRSDKEGRYVYEFRGRLSEVRFDRFNFHLGFTSTFQLICAIFYIGFILYLMFIQIKAFFHFKSNYFRQFWSYIDLYESKN